MAELIAPFSETEDLYAEVIAKHGLDKFMRIVIVSDNKLKDLFKVVKSSPLLKYRSGDDINIIINETIFDGLTDEQRNIVVEESLAGIHYDTEKDKIVITKPDVVTFSGILSKYGFEKWNLLRETTISLYNTEKDNEDKAASATSK